MYVYEGKVQNLDISVRELSSSYSIFAQLDSICQESIRLMLVLLRVMNYNYFHF